MKTSSDTIGNRTRNLPACSAVPQPTAQPRAPTSKLHAFNNLKTSFKIIRLAHTVLYVEPPGLCYFHAKKMRE